ncbi:helix-turn-helix domain-containing protein [Mycolicibacterium sp. A43C]
MSDLRLPELQADAATPRRHLLTVAEAAIALKIGKTKLYELFAAGELAWVQIGAHRRVAEAEIDRFIADHTERSAVPA